MHIASENMIHSDDVTSWLPINWPQAHEYIRSGIIEFTDSEMKALEHAIVNDCLSVTLVVHAQTVQHTKMPFAPYDRAKLDAWLQAISVVAELLV